MLYHFTTTQRCLLKVIIMSPRSLLLLYHHLLAPRASSSFFFRGDGRGNEVVECFQQLRPGERFGDHLVGTAGHEEVDVLRQRVACDAYHNHNRYDHRNN